ncbi:MAG TPA: formyltetrahydrofolate deformylase [Solirubrobacterales bacterium]|nr:formyltetrahydrofolate deformylase [Solirubrobacterales bacterium]
MRDFASARGNGHDLRIAQEAETTRILLACPDRPGLIATVSGFLAEAGLNIVDVDQHSTAAGQFFMRMVFDSPRAADRGALEERFRREIATPFEMDHSFSESGRAKRVAVMVSREDHCLSDLLWRRRNGHLGGEIVTVVSNHEDLRDEVEAVGIPFHHVPNDRETRPAAERRALELIGDVDLLVLARYMQILSPAFLLGLDAPAINIHHSFLPAFVGADPYARAHERGVKLIGATAHYVSAELDAGPIIDQDVVRVGHQDEVPDLVRIGRDVERLVLARAVTAHLEDRVLLDGGRTVVF